MDNVIQFSGRVFICPECFEPMKQGDDGNYRCHKDGCGIGQISSPTGVRVIRKNGYTVLEPKR